MGIDVAEMKVPRVRINGNGPGKDLREGGRCHQSSVLIMAEYAGAGCGRDHKSGDWRPLLM